MSELKITLLEHTPNPDKIVAAAAKLCYASGDIDSILEGLDPMTVNQFVNRLSDLGHESPFEHVSFTFGVEQVSRITEQQLTRHRLSSYSIQSGRYVKRGKAKFTVPPSIKSNQKANALYQDFMNLSKQIYEEIVEALTEEHYQTMLELRTWLSDTQCKEQAVKMAIEDARYVYPNSIQTKIIFTMNARTLLNFASERCCNRAQWEIRDMANKMIPLVKAVAPATFLNMGPACKCGICPEGAMQCEEFKDLIPNMNDVRKLIKEHFHKE